MGITLEQVAQYLQQSQPALALVRLCRLGCGMESGLSRLSRWEQKPPVEATFFQARLKSGNNPPNADELAAHPLDWLRALDEFLYAETHARRDVLIREGDARFWLVRRPIPTENRGYRARQLGSVFHHLCHHRVIPETVLDIPTQVCPTDEDSETACARILAKQQLRVAVVRFDDDAEESICWDHSCNHFHVSGLEHPESRLAALRSALLQAQNEGADLVVFPELTIPADMRDQILDELFNPPPDDTPDDTPAAAPVETPFDIPFVLLGSFHERDDQQQLFNRSILVNRHGSTLLTTDKRAKVTFPYNGGNWGEALQTAPTPFGILPLDIGLLSTAICKDVFEKPIHTVLDEIGPEWLLAPSMTDDLKPHTRKTGDLRRAFGTITIVANQPMPGCTLSGERFPHGYVELSDPDPKHSGPKPCQELITLFDLPLPAFA